MKDMPNDKKLSPGLGRSGMVLFFGLLVFLINTPLLARDPALRLRLVRDINAFSWDSWHYIDEFPMCSTGDWVFFTSVDPIFGKELWKTNGTASGTRLVLDLWPGMASSAPGDFLNFGGVLYFTANDGSNGREFWKSDGTAQRTAKVKEINVGPAGSDPESLTAIGTHIIFSAYNPQAGRELWLSDGTTTGTVLKDLSPGSSSSNPRQFLKHDGKIYFLAADPIHGTEVWVSDGTSDGTRLFRDIVHGSADISPLSLYVLDGVLHLLAKDGAETVLWRCDGTAQGTRPLMTLDPRPGADFSSFPSQPFAWRKYLFYFSGETTTHKGSDYPDRTTKLIRTDGTPGGSQVLLTKGEYTGFLGTETYYSPLVSMDNGVYFSENIYSDHGASNESRLYRVNETGLVRIQNFWMYYETEGRIGAMEVLGNTLFFNEANNLWATDGTMAGMNKFYSIEGGYFNNMTVVGDELFFLKDRQDGNELWKSDGTTMGTQPVIKSLGFRTGTHSLAPATVINGELYFFLSPGRFQKIWKTNGSACGTVQVGALPNLPADEDSTISTSSVTIGAIRYYIHDDSTTSMDRAHGKELWMSDGTPQGTRMVADLHSGEAGSSPGWLVKAGERLYFAANDGVFGNELWTLDPDYDIWVGGILSGQTFLAGRPMTIAWRTNINTAGTAVRLELWKGDSKVCDLLKAYNPFGYEENEVTVPNVPAGTDYTIKAVSLWDNRYQDMLERPFTIQEISQVTSTLWQLYQ